MPGCPSLILGSEDRHIPTFWLLLQSLEGATKPGNASASSRARVGPKPGKTRLLQISPSNQSGFLGRRPVANNGDISYFSWGRALNSKLNPLCNPSRCIEPLI